MKYRAPSASPTVQRVGQRLEVDAAHWERTPPPQRSGPEPSSNVDKRDQRAADAKRLSVESDGPACPHSEDETTARVDRIADWVNQTTA